MAVITPISLEHTAILGDTIRQIAGEKAAIITPGCTVVMAPQQYPDAEDAIRECAAEIDDEKLEKYLDAEDTVDVDVARRVQLA